MLKNSLLLNFLKEEIRLQTSFYNKRNFYTYPITIFLFFLMITLLGIWGFNRYNQDKVSLVMINIFFVGGVMSGAFGLYAQDYLERKFGDFGRLFSNTLILPIKLNMTFITLAISDTIFYLFWFIIPVILGFGLANIILGYSFYKLPILFLCVFLMFMLGLFLTFFLSVLYQKNRVIFSFISIALLSSVVYFYFNKLLINFFVYSLYLRPNFIDFIHLMLVLTGFGLLSYFSVGNTFNTKVIYHIQKKSLKFPKLINHYVFKDYIDLKRTGGLLGKPLFTVFVPAILLLLLFSSVEILQSLKINTLFFAIIIGTLGTQLLNSLIYSDDFKYYRYLPVELKTYMSSKMKLAFSICFFNGFLVLLFYSIYTNNLVLVINSSIILAFLLIYNFSLSFYLTGLSPNENLMQTRTFLLYFIFYIPLLFILIIANIYFNSILYYLLFLIGVLIASNLFFKIGVRKWG